MRFPIFMLAGILTCATVGAAQEEWHSQMYRHEHTELNVRLDNIEKSLIALSKQEPKQQEQTMKEIVKLLKENWDEHSKWEEQVLYPAIDNYTSCQDYPFTSTQRQEHVIIKRWIEELQTLSGQGASKASDFALRGIELIGLLHAHRECEEQVLLPIFNKHFPPKEAPEEEEMTNTKTKGT